MIITYYTVNRYQRSKDKKLIRDDLINIHAKSFSKLTSFFRAWNKYFDKVIDIALESKDDEDLKPPSSEEVYITLNEFDVERRLLFGKILIHLELDEHNKKKYVENDVLFSKIGTTVDHILRNIFDILSKDNASTIAEDITIFYKMYSGLIDILLDAEIKN